LNPLKKLLGQTAIYGLPSILGRLLNYLLVPLHTYYMNPSAYGVVSELYAWVAFLVVLLTFGMETAFFRFLNEKEDKALVFRNSFLTIIGLNGIFFLAVVAFNQPIADAMLYSAHNEYIILLAAIVAIDSISSLPLAKLRAEEKAGRFATIQSISIAVNIALNLVLMIFFFDKAKPEEGVMFILMANLIASLVKPAMLYKDFLHLNWVYNADLAIEMLKYALPLVIAGFAGIINETIDRILLKFVTISNGGTEEFAMIQVGIYSASYKLAMLVTILLQAYRYAAEPFFFSQSKNKDRNKVYIKIMNYFVAMVCFIFLLVSLNIDIFKHFIANEAYWEGLKVVPILLLANVFLGIYFNQSIWYKLSGQTKFGAYIALFGAFFTITLNLLFIPKYGFMACAYATMFVYAFQMVASYLLGQKHYPIKYNLRKFFLFLGSSLFLFWVSHWFDFTSGGIVKFIFNNFLIVLYVGIFFFIENPFKKKDEIATSN
jgi:O-antigen/teichoic acid export membrane protein